MDHPLPGLKYVAAKGFDASGLTFDSVDVSGADGEKLGDVEGFIMDVPNGRPRHLVVSAGWFIHKHFLLPIGHVNLKPGTTNLVTDVTKERVNNFPGFDKDEFEKLGADELIQLDAKMVAPWETGGGGGAPRPDQHYEVPDWWTTPAGTRR